MLRKLIFPLLGLAVACAAAGRKPNILWLIGDDLGTELGCYGDRDAQTPHLDGLAAAGVRWTHFYTTAPVCSPARSAFNTGMYAHALGAENHRPAARDKRPLPAGVRVLSAWLRDAGYFTANLAEFPPGLALGARAKTDWNFLPGDQPFDSARWSDLASHQPFYAQINLEEPHRDFHALRVTDPAALSLPPFYPDTPVVRGDWAMYLDAVAELDRKVGLVLRQLEAEGLAESTIIVVFGDNGRCQIRDKQFCYEEGLHVPLLIRWPKHFPAPAGFAAGTVNDHLVEAVDLPPTMLSLAGAPIPPAMQGRAFAGPAAGAPREYAFGARDRCDETVLHLRTVRDARYRYILNLTPDKPLMSPNRYKEEQYPAWNVLKRMAAAHQALTPAQVLFAGPSAPAEELYDLESDPGQLQNLAGDPALQPVLLRLRAALRQWRTELGEPPSN